MSRRCSDHSDLVSSRAMIMPMAHASLSPVGSPLEIDQARDLDVEYGPGEGDRSMSAAGAEVDETAWMEKARCRGSDPERFFPSPGTGFELARQVCAECPVQSECLEYALTNRIDLGVWGGVSQRERKRILQRRRKLAAGGT
jgi:WhiB family redox-sensing transcriptional regulator